MFCGYNDRLWAVGFNYSVSEANDNNFNYFNYFNYLTTIFFPFFIYIPFTAGFAGRRRP